jgi:hypothetical protein
MKSNKLTIFLRNAESVSGVRVLDTAYEVDGENGSRQKRVLTDQLIVKEVGLTNSLKKLHIELNENNIWTYTVDLSKYGISDEKLDDIKKWAKEHPILGKWDDEGRSMFVFRFDDDAVATKSSEDEEKVDVFYKFRTLTFDEQKSIAVYFGLAPWELDEKQIQNELVGLNGGIITSIATARREFLNSIDNMFDEVALNFKSAVLNKVIVEYQPDAYSLNGETIGSSSIAAIAMLKQRPELFSIVERELRSKNKYLTTQAKKKEIQENKVKVEKQEKLDGDLEELGVVKKAGRPAKVD